MVRRHKLSNSVFAWQVSSHGGKAQEEREAAVKLFKQGQVCVCWFIYHAHRNQHAHCVFPSVTANDKH